MAEAMNGLVDGMDDVERAAVTRRLTGTVEILRRSTAEPIRTGEADGQAGRRAPAQ
ncbi:MULTISPECIES: hypothetical protein [Streptomyces]|uniref:MarR family transcriptional regulator n=1 Tax=Streptomyces badius TaxID=1941 RepID=A0ABQ2T3A8_STRBA|nr:MULTISPECIES: hypothetical protein [Streptomyces]GGS48272.1 hypothetical protein GCM10010253_23220 [Streptomyces badius]